MLIGDKSKDSLLHNPGVATPMLEPLVSADLNKRFGCFEKLKRLFEAFYNYFKTVVKIKIVWFFLVFSLAIDLFKVRIQYRSNSTYITRRKRIIRGSNC
jgi:hypothetical protein